MSTTVGPLCLRLALSMNQRRAALDAAAAFERRDQLRCPELQLLKLDIRCLERWGLMDDILTVIERNGYSAVDFRSDALGRDAVFEAFLKFEPINDRDDPEGSQPTVLEYLELPYDTFIILKSIELTDCCYTMA